MKEVSNSTNFNLYPKETEKFNNFVKTKDYKELLHKTIHWLNSEDKRYSNENPMRINIPKDKKILIFTVGIPGSGKTTAGEEITNKYDMILANGIEIYKKILMDIDSDFYLTYHLLSDSIKYFSKQNRSIFYHGSSRTKGQRQIITNFAKENNYQYFAVNIRCSKDIAFNRILQRQVIEIGYSPELLIIKNKKRMLDFEIYPESKEAFNKFLAEKGKTFETATERDYQEMHFYGESSWSNLTTFAENEYNPIEINGDLELEQFKNEAIKKITYRINRYI